MVGPSSFPSRAVAAGDPLAIGLRVACVRSPSSVSLCLSLSTVSVSGLCKSPRVLASLSK